MTDLDAASKICAPKATVLEEEGVPVKSGDSYTKLQALGTLVESHIAQDMSIENGCLPFLRLENNLETYEEGQEKLYTFTQCMEVLEKNTVPALHGHSSHTAMARTQWDNSYIRDSSSILYATLCRVLSRPFSDKSCRGHQAYLRLNGFDLEETEKPTSFDLFLSTCSFYNGWREGRYTSIQRYL